jgi:phage shock protein C
VKWPTNQPYTAFSTKSAILISSLFLFSFWTAMELLLSNAVTAGQIKDKGGYSMKKLYRSRTERRIWGVCGGLADYFGVDPALIRIIAAISTFYGLGIMVYTVMAMESTAKVNT